MFKKFSGGCDGSWPLSKIVAALKSQYGSADVLGEDGPLKVYGVEDNGVSFVVALMQSAPKSGKVIELGFLARFVGFPVDARLIEGLNRSLHISVASLEGADIFLMAGMQVTGEREVLVPPHLHWGRIGYGDNAIPPDATLSIAIRLDAID